MNKLRLIYRFKYLKRVYLKTTYIITLLIVIILCFIPNIGNKAITLGYFPHMDKIVHFSMFLGLNFWGILWQHRIKRNLSFIISISISTAILTELIQSYLIAGRHGSFTDFLADMLGMGAAILITRMLKVKFN